MDKPFAASCERNKAPILQVLQPLYAGVRRVLEIGSGTGQHALHFAAAMPHLVWQCSDVPAHLPGMQLWLDEAALPNLPPPLALDVNQGLPGGRFDAVFTANTLHIMGWSEVQRLFEGLAALLPPERPVHRLRALQPRRALHQRGQRALRCRAAPGRPAPRHPRLRGRRCAGPRRRAAAAERRADAGQQPLRQLAAQHAALDFAPLATGASHSRSGWLVKREAGASRES